MKYHIFILTSILALGITTTASEMVIEFPGLRDWKKDIVENVVFSAELQPISKLLDKLAAEDEPIFLVFSCEAKDNLGKRLLWIDADVTFSSGAVRKLKGIRFHILSKGIEYDIVKLDPGVLSQQKDALSVTVTKLKVTNVAVK